MTSLYSVYPLRVFSRKVQAMRESLLAGENAAPHEDLSKPMGEILREEER